MKEINKYDDWTIELDFSAGTVDLTGWKFYRTLKSNLNADDPGDYQLSHTATAGEISSKIVVLKIPAASLAALPGRIYFHDLKIISSDGISTVVKEQVVLVPTSTKAVT